MFEKIYLTAVKSHDFKENHTSEKIVNDLIIRIDTGMRGSHDFKGNRTFKKYPMKSMYDCGRYHQGNFRKNRGKSSVNQCVRFTRF